MKNKNKYYFYVFGLIICGFLFFASMMSFISQGQLAFFNKVVYEPSFGTAKCSAIDGTNMQLRSLGEIDDSGEYYDCKNSDKHVVTYIPPGKNCEFTINPNGASGYVDSWICADTATTYKDNTCVKQTNIWSNDISVATTMPLSSSKRLFVNPNTLYGKVKMQARYPAYGLEVKMASGYEIPQAIDCKLNSIYEDDKVHIAGDKDKSLDELNNVYPSIPLNMVMGLKPAISRQVVIIEGINGGNPIYITRPRGYYQKVKEAEDGFLYVDTESGEFKDSKIQCIPGLPGCSDEAKKIALSDTACDKYGGSIVGYAPTTDNPNELCTYTCTDGKLRVNNNDCITIQDCTPEMPFFNYQTGQCEAVTSESVCEEGYHQEIVKKEGFLSDVTTETCVKNSNYTLLWIALLFLVGAISFYVATRLTKKNKRGR